ncbi:MAG: tetratricopeptide repeat protein [Gammaproteobacteria bacterium]|nr:hypothetical protein [Gammaproteobacteria bacterium]
MNSATLIARAGCSALLCLFLAACASHVLSSAEAQDAAVADPSSFVEEAEAALQRGEYLAASKAYLRAAMDAQDELLAEQAARVAYEHRQWSIAAQAAARWLELNETSEEARRHAAFVALQLYQLDEAAEHLGALLETAYINPQAGFLALLPQLAEELPEAAVTSVLQKLVAKYPDLAEAHYALAQSALQSDNFALALEHAQKARELGPYWSPAALLLARAQLLTGHGEHALETVKAVLENDDRDTHRLEYALLLLQLGREEEGKKELAALASGDEVSVLVERALADLDFRLGNNDAAAKRYTNLVTSGRFVYESLYYLGAIAESRQNWNDALQLYSRVAGSDFATAAQMRAARIKIKQEGLEAGLKHMEDFGAARPRYRIESITARAALLAENGEPAAAIELLDQAIEQYPDVVDLRYARVFQLEATDQVNAAIDELRALLAKRPDDPVALNALGYTLVDRTTRYREGYNLIEQALRQTPDSGAVLDSMGWALHRLGRHEEALEYLEKARRRISDPEVEEHLGAVLMSLGREDEARTTLMRAIERFPEHDDLKKRLQELDAKKR